MSIKRPLLPAIVFFGVIFLQFASPRLAAGGQGGADQPPVLVASVPPQAWFLEQLAGDRAEVRSLIQPGYDAHNFDPTPRQVQLLSQAAIVFTTGLEFERGIVPALQQNNPDLLVVDLRIGVRTRSMEAHYHDPKSPHTHETGNPDPHIWLGPNEALVQAESMYRVLAARFGQEFPNLRANYVRLVQTIHETRAELDRLLVPLAGQYVLVYHPAFGYLTDTYGMVQLPIQAGGREPSPRLLNIAIDEALRLGIRTVFAQPEYDDTAAVAIARAIGGKTVEITDLGTDWPQLVLGIARAFAGHR